MRKKNTILGIDWGSKYIGVAYMDVNQSVPQPFGYIENDASALFTIADTIVRYRSSVVAIGYPEKQKDVQQKIQSFVTALGHVIDQEKVDICLIPEDYTTVQAGEIISNYKKNVATDTVSAMIILDRYRDLYPLEK